MNRSQEICSNLERLYGYKPFDDGGKILICLCRDDSPVQIDVELDKDECPNGQGVGVLIDRKIKYYCEANDFVRFVESAADLRELRATVLVEAAIEKALEDMQEKELVASL